VDLRRTSRRKPLQNHPDYNIIGQGRAAKGKTLPPITFMDGKQMHIGPDEFGEMSHGDEKSQTSSCVCAEKAPTA
jgi:hypothetical protein